MKLGNLYATRRIKYLMQRNLRFREEVNTAINMYTYEDWGITCSEDAQANDEAVVMNEKILAVYETCRGRIWIITDTYRSSTTILFPSEY